MTSIKDIEAKLTKKDRGFIDDLRHPNRQILKYYAHSVGLTRTLRSKDYKWLNENTTEPYSVDYTIAPHNISFTNVADAVLFKLTFGGTLACKPHKKS